jgi:hypothetical protein
MYDCIKGNGPENMKNLFRKISSTSGHNTRSATSKSENVFRKTVKGSAARQSFRARRPECWNELPAELQGIEKKRKFKTELKNYYLENYKTKIDCSNSQCNDVHHCNHVIR